MNRFLTVVAATLALGAAASAVQAADLEPACDSSWAGGYVGVHGGYAFGDGTGLGDTANLSGFMGGGLAGINHQSCSLVYGIEGDFGIGEIDGSKGNLQDFDIEPNGHLRFRLGLAYGDFLPFVAAGLAISDIDVRSATNVNNSFTHFGLTAGAGVDFRVAEAFVVRGEYLFDMYNEVTYFGVSDVGADTHTLRAALIWHFN